MNTDRRVLQGHTPVMEPDLLKWARWLEDDKNRIVRQTAYADEKVSTVFLGLDHSFGFGPPILFETLVFGGKLDGEMTRCSTWDEAEKMHDEMLERTNIPIDSWRLSEEAWVQYDQ